MVKSTSYRFAHLRGWSALGLILAVLALLGGMIWRNLDQLETIRGYVIYQHRIQQVAFDLQDTLTNYFAYQNRQLDASRLARLSAETNELAQDDRHVDPETPAKLAELSSNISALASEDTTSKQQEARLLRSLSITGAMMDAENFKREALLEEIGRTTRTEVEIALVSVATLLVLMVLFLNYRILAPLRDLEQLLLRLARGDFTPIETQKIDTLLLPVFFNYNLMVRQLAELREAERLHAENLEGEVRSATRALLQLQASLARNERLAAVGELAAGIAHELRNPLAAIQMTCANLRKEIADTDQVERISMIIGELKRMSRLLNELLDQAKHTPEIVQNFNLAEMTRELVKLTRYQISPIIQLDFKGPDQLTCHLPEGRLRQCLLNLILNAAEAIGDKPGTIKIEAQTNDKKIQLKVTDTGPGYPDEILISGIRPFVTGNPGGTGLGLAMVQRFVRDLGGQLNLVNIQPHGASITLTVPRRFQ